MGFLRDVIHAWQYRKKDSVTSQDFLEAMRRDFGRELDSESVFFFRHHAITVNLVNRILAGKLKASGDEKKDGLVIQALIAEISEYTPTAANISLESPTLIADLIEEFSKTYKDAANIVGQALAVFLELK